MLTNETPSASLATGPGCVAVVNGEGHIVRLERTAGVVLGRIGLSDTACSLLVAGPPELRHVVKGALGQPPVSGTTTLGVDDRTYELRAAPLLGRDSEVRALIQIRDTTYEHRLEERCMALEKYEGFDRLIASVVHDVRNPLAAATTLVETVQLLPDQTPKARERLGQAMNQIERAIEILGNLVRFSRDEMPTFNAHSLTRLVEETVQLQRTAAQRRGVAIETRLDPDLPPVYADATQLRQVVVNLISNAVDAVESTGQKGLIKVSTSYRLGIIRLMVEDDGPGVPPDLVQRVFMPFFTTKPSGKGTGLGLAISHGIAKSHGGHLWYRPRRPHGSCFTLDLPDPRSMVPAKEKAFMGVSRSKTPAAQALVVDPDERQLEAATQYLRRNGYKVHVATTGSAAFPKLAATRFDLVVCACEMSDMRVEDLLRQILKLDPTYKERLVLSSADPDSASFQELLQRTGLPSLKAPYGTQEMKVVVDSLQPSPTG